MINNMFCIKCGKRILDNSKFCEFCGAKVEFESEEHTYPKVSDKYKVEHIGYPRKTRRAKRHIDTGQLFSNHWRKALFLIIIGLIIWGVASDDGTESREFPQYPYAEPKTVTFDWSYKGSQYSITETFYKAVYDYYNSDPKKWCWYEDEEENFEPCLKDFSSEPEGDNTISKIASDIKALAIKNGLNQDEIVELVVAFVQSIPYDYYKFELVASLPDYYDETKDDVDVEVLTNTLPRYPYEVLYDKQGICTGKTFLAASLLKELGYGVVLFFYEEIEGGVGHLVPAIKCPKAYSSYNSGYCYAEITGTGFRIGEVPYFDIDTNKPKIRKKIELFGEDRDIELSWSELGNIKIYEIADGNTYQGVIETAQVLQKIKTLEKELGRLYNIIVSLKSELTQLENNVDYYDQQAEMAYRRHEILRDDASYSEYRNLFSKYESAYNKYITKLNEYHRKIDNYNNIAIKYNALIEDFYH